MVSISRNNRQHNVNGAVKTAPASGGSKRQSVVSFLSGVFCTFVAMYSIQGGMPKHCWNDANGNSRPTDRDTMRVAIQDEAAEKKKPWEAKVEESAESALRKPQLKLDTSAQTGIKTEPLKPQDSNSNNHIDDWKWYEGDVNAYYNELEKDIKRDPSKIDKYAVHRWMGPSHSTKIHYELLLQSIVKYTGRIRPNGIQNLNALDAGCGLGSALMFMEQNNPTWTLSGRTLSEEQVNFVTTKVPAHKFTVELGSYNELPVGAIYDAIYSIEAMIHSTDIHATLRAWANHLHPEHGAIVVIDDFLMPGANKDELEMQLFAKGWMANSFYTVTELNNIARKYGLELVESRDLLAEYRVIELNYRNQAPNLAPDGSKTHQGWMGSKWRHKLTVEGKIAYNMVVFQKMGAKKASLESLLASSTPPAAGFTANAASSTSLPRDDAEAIGQQETCKALPTADSTNALSFTRISPKKECISSWYCCDKGHEWFDNMQAKRTHGYGFLKLERNIFGNYMDVFAKHLNQLYETMPEGYSGGRFLDIGATGSTASGMQQVTSKFAHFTGPLDYWMLDSDVGAKSLNNTIYCDIVDCPQAETCGFDVTFSHTVLEHASRPEKTFDTIARITKKGGLTMHLVPWSYQYHATPDDYYRFSHSALRVLVSQS